MSTYEDSLPNSAIVGRLTIERCQVHVAHLLALMHLCEPVATGTDTLVAESMLRIVKDLESDLMHSAKAISEFQSRF